ncbi:hypothetical protein AB832_01405 [Flavobacteriaceae bacterium (ex Bugula neritina AB1)]|nr:hypothetical protein AB832_01405 [Flavobacteriaceae bacterium (ex Bugula neritina AB1)]
MKILNFIESIRKYSPTQEVLMSRGYSESFSKNIIDKQFNLQEVNNRKEVSSFLQDFLQNYEVESFEINKISFSDILEEEINDYTTIAGIEGGYLVIKENDPAIYILFSDDEDNVELFCSNEDEFFELLIVFAEFSSKVFKGEINPFDEEVKSSYLEKCNKINPLTDYDMFL